MKTWTGWIIISQKLQYPENERNKLYEIKELGLDKGTPSIYFVSIKGGLPIKLGTSSRIAHWHDRVGLSDRCGPSTRPALSIRLWQLSELYAIPSCHWLSGIPVSIHVIGTSLCRYLVQTSFSDLSKPQSPGPGLQQGQLCREMATTLTRSIILSVLTVFFNEGQGCKRP